MAPVASHGEVWCLIVGLQRQLDAGSLNTRNEVSHTVHMTVESDFETLREKLDKVAHSIFNRMLQNGNMLEMIMKNMNRAADFRLYLRNLVTASL